jgi:hypothetical protein
MSEARVVAMACTAVLDSGSSSVLLHRTQLASIRSGPAQPTDPVSLHRLTSATLR